MQNRLRIATLAGFAVALLVSWLVACSDSDSPSAPTGSTVLRVELTDAPTDELAAVNVYISGLTVKPVDGPVERITNDVGLVDLLSLQDSSELLVIAEVEPGDYEFIRVELNEAASSVVDAATNEQLPLKIPSTEIKVLGGFVVAPDQTTTVLLDFDANQSLVQQGNGNWLLKPVIVLAGVDSD
jgi:hypothetical protein